MDFCHLIVTCLFSMLRLPFDNQKVKGNYAIFLCKLRFKQNQSFSFLKSFSAKDIEKYLCDDEDNVPLIKENIETKPPITLYKP